MTKNFEERFLTARREYIARQFSNMNPRQLEAVLTTEGPLLLLAGAGSGKTTVLIHRIANLIRFGCGADSKEIPEDVTEEDVIFLEGELSNPTDGWRAERLCTLHPADPWSIIAITFTNKAANELKDRLGGLLGAQGEGVWAMTFHSACCRILRREIERLGYSSSFTIYDTADSERVMKEVLRDRNLDEKVFPPRAVLGVISKAKDKQQSPAEFALHTSDDFRLKRIAELYGDYQQRLKAANAVDFDDIILLTVQLLQQVEEVRDYYQRKFRYVLIDEYQDTNNLQYLLASLLAGRYENICVVGDDDQSIYRFRGATIQNILDFESQFHGAKVIRLEQNYRSTQSILDAANAVISNNIGRKGKRLWTNNSVGEKILHYEAANESDEAAFVANNILSESKGRHLNDFAILYRTNAQSNALEYAFKRSGVRYRIIGGTRFFDRAEVKDVLAYLNVIASPSDDLRLVRIINNPPRGIGARSVELAQQIAAQERLSLFEVVSHADSYPELQRPAIKMRQFASMIRELHAQKEKLTPDELLDELLEKTGYLRALEEKNTTEDEARAENVRELKTSIIAYMKESGDSSLEGFLADVALYTDLDNYDKDADCVVMMTMHSAKGLEFPTVFIVGMEESIFPGIRAIGEPGEMEEERRLCYVAITRAMTKLHLVCARQRMLFGRTTANRVSRFVDEIPEEDIEKKNVPKGYGFHDRREELGFARKAPERQQYGVSAPRPKAPTVQASVSFSVGDRVNHKAFGPGCITKMTPMGGDFLIEINFDKIGTKKLMLRAAAQHMSRE